MGWNHVPQSLDGASIIPSEVGSESNPFTAEADSINDVEFVSGGGTGQDIQDAIDSLPASGGVVFVDVGTYVVSGADETVEDCINPANNTVIRGAGYGTHLKVDDQTQLDAMYLNGVNNVLIENLRVDGNKANQDSADFKKNGGTDLEEWLCGIYAENCSNVTISNVWAVDAPNPCIHIQDGNLNCNIFNSYISGSEWNGVQYWQGGGNSRIVGNYAEDCYNSEIIVEIADPDAEGATHCAVNSNTVVGRESGKEKSVLSVITGSDFCTINGNVVRNAGINIGGGADWISVTGNVVDADGNADTMQVFGEYVTVTGNSFRNASFSGIRLRGPGKVIVSNNTVENTNLRGLWVDQSTTDCLIEGNRFDNADGGIVADDNLSNSIIRNNIIANVTDTITGMDGTNLVRGNKGHTSTTTVTATAPALGWENETVLIDASSNNVDAVLPDPTLYPDEGLTLKAIDVSNTAKFSQSGSETIDGSAEKTLANQYDAFQVVSDGTDWQIVASV